MTDIGGGAPLSGVVVLDATRHLPGAVLARALIDLGARLIKVEDPKRGDPLREAPPLVAGTGAGFAVLLRGAESIALDLGSAGGAEAFGRLAARADVVAESFRPGTMDRFGLGAEALRAKNRGLVYCTISGYGSTGAAAKKIAHDMNLTASSGVLELLPLAQGIPRVQLADVSTGLLAANAIVAALLRRARTGEGATLDQPLATGVMPLLSWAWADVAGGGGGMNERALAGESPGYRVYRCGDGQRLAVGTLEAKFWKTFCELLGLPHLAERGLELGEGGREAIAQVQAALETRSREHWLSLFEDRALPISPVDSLERASAPDGFFASLGLTEQVPLADGDTLEGPGSYFPSLRSPGPVRRAPGLGEHTEALLAELAPPGRDG